jgi:hypothetical protein
MLRLCVPRARLSSDRVAEPPLSGPEASNVAPSKMLAVPVGVPVDPDTVTEILTDWPTMDGLGTAV